MKKMVMMILMIGFGLVLPMSDSSAGPSVTVINTTSDPVPVTALPHTTTLIFNTPPGSQHVPQGVTDLPPLPQTIDVSNCSEIRFFADNRSDSSGDVNLNLTMLDAANGQIFVGPLDSVTLIPNSNINKVYGVPGLGLQIIVTAAGAGGADVDIWIWCR